MFEWTWLKSLLYICHCKRSLHLRLFLFHVSDWMVSLNLRGWRRSTVMRVCLLAWLPLNQEPSSIYCSQRKMINLSRKITQGIKNIFVVVFCWILVFQRVFVSRFSIFNYASALLLFGIFLFYFGGCPVWFLYRKEEKKGFLCVSLCVLCRGFIQLKVQQKRLWIALL